MCLVSEVTNILVNIITMLVVLARGCKVDYIKIS